MAGEENMTNIALLKNQFILDMGLLIKNLVTE
ncbi:hypothetical protein VIBC2010_00939 [Vibrio caribbeanicus ATCC BAA-2122]|uniref:Uncharacterized protein n=1 Tax=Vibrio caribbeanicus ATCC BAA-2122 TaxID=796620 RepID=E3BGK9_9VIBR|nr:hypothetical protein VIBC2010_00939 [Vibrio caribbeanicus ATCC BAA-2122]